MVNIGNSWDSLLADQFEQEYYLLLRRFLISEYKTCTVYPDKHDIFNALKLTDYGDVRAVILGQDPYHGPGQAHGLCFSVREGQPAPPSLVNIFAEIEAELAIPRPTTGDLTPWAKRGILLLNTVLTVRAGAAGSHRGRGWEQLTDKVIELLAKREEPIAFMLWGANAISKKPVIEAAAEGRPTEAPPHLILTSPHPSPLSAHRGFFGNGHFRSTNDFFLSCGTEPIDFSLE